MKKQGKKKISLAEKNMSSGVRRQALFTVADEEVEDEIEFTLPTEFGLPLLDLPEDLRFIYYCIFWDLLIF